MAYTLAQLLTRVRDILNESTGGFWTDTQINTYIGDAAADISAVVKCVEATTTLAMVTSTRNYTLPTDTVEVLHAQNDATGRGIARVTPSSAGGRSIQTSGDTPLGWYRWAGELWIEPIPDATMNGKVVRVFYAKSSQDITALPEDCQLAAIDYALYRAKQQNQKYAEAGAIYAAYLNKVVFLANDIYAHTPHAISDLTLADVSEEA